MSVILTFFLFFCHFVPSDGFLIKYFIVSYLYIFHIIHPSFFPGLA